MKINKILIGLIIFILCLNFINADTYYQSEEYNNIVSGLTLSEIFYNISYNIIENNSEIISLNIDDSILPYTLNFISDDYATLNNISCDDTNCTLFGTWKTNKNIYILPESIVNYYNLTTLNATLSKISNTFTHELTHMYIDNINPFYTDMLSVLGSSNPNDFNTLNLTDIPYPINNTVNFPSAISSYPSGERMEEIIVRIISVCFQEKQSYTYYWQMVETKNYTMCNSYTFPIYLDNNIAGSYEDVITAYVEQYLDIIVEDTIAKQTEQLPQIGSDIGNGIQNISYPLFSVVFFFSIILMIATFFASIITVLKCYFKKK